MAKCCNEIFNLNNFTSKVNLFFFLGLSDQIKNLTNIRCNHGKEIPSTSHATSVKSRYSPVGDHFLFEKDSSNAQLTDEERSDLIFNARSISRIIKWAECLVRSENGLLCTFCGLTIFYNFNDGEDFSNSVLPSSFRHLKYNVKRHLKSNRHSKNMRKVLQTNQKNLHWEKQNKESALNCAACAYLTYKLDTSYASYESIIAEMYNSGASVGVKNHSKEFSRNFLPHVHQTFKKEITNFIMQNNLPIGLLADKITLNHRTRHIIGIRIPIFDIKRKVLFESIYLEHQWVDDATGDGVSSDFINTLAKFGFDLPFVRKNLVGVAADGQYIKLGVDKHLKKRLVRDISLAWDPMHRLELAQKHADMPKVVKESFELVQEVMKEFNFGKKYEVLLECAENINEFFYKPKIFKSMKFVGYCETVLITFLNDYKSFVCACEKIAENFTMRDRLMSRYNIFNVLLTTDLYHLLAVTSKNVQSGDLLPWEYFNKIKDLLSALEIFNASLQSVTSANVESFEDLSLKISSLPKHLFKNLILSQEMFLQITFKGVPLPEIQMEAKCLRSSNSHSEISAFTTAIKSFSNYSESLVLKINDYFFAQPTAGDILIEKANFLFNFEYLIYPRSSVSVEQAESSKGFDKETFTNYLKDYHSILILKTTDEDSEILWFEYQQLTESMIRAIDESRKSGIGYEIKTLFKKAVNELHNQLPNIIHLFTFAISIPVSEAICESWGSVIDTVSQQRMRSTDGSDSETGTIDKRVFIFLNGPPAGFSKTRKFLKASLISMFGSCYYNHFKRISPSCKLPNKISSNVVAKITNSADCLPCFM